MDAADARYSLCARHVNAVKQINLYSVSENCRIPILLIDIAPFSMVGWK